MQPILLNNYSHLHDPSTRDLGPIADFLEASGAELCVLTECRKAATCRLAERLGCAGAAHAHAPYYGNGLLTRTLTIEHSATIDLPRAVTGELRSAVSAEVVAPWGPCGSWAPIWSTCVRRIGSRRSATSTPAPTSRDRSCSAT